MADVIAIDKKLKMKDKERSELIRMRKILAVRKIFHCTHCASKCEKCGTQIGVSDEFPHSKLKKHKIPYNFCESCKEEYLDYIDRLRGGGNPEYYWHNENWLDIWQKWIDYQHTIDCYLKSKEFNRLLQELKQPEPNP